MYSTNSIYIITDNTICVRTQEEIIYYKLYLCIFYIMRFFFVKFYLFIHQLML
jgi:hypothetical protein